MCHSIHKLKWTGARKVKPGPQSETDSDDSCEYETDSESDEVVSESEVNSSDIEFEPDVDMIYDEWYFFYFVNRE